MPTYEFRCPKGHEFEQFYKTISSAPSVVTCPECGVVAVRKLSVGGLVFKGSGFYLTDYGKNAHRGEKLKAEGATSDGSKSDSSTGEGAEPKAQSSEPKAPSSEPKAPSSEPKAPSSKPQAPSPKPQAPSEPAPKPKKKE